ncbi:protein MAINTENANCE OF MERISTEMS-like protein [Cinnamomum micranthum f. kanehirae]|uniref:Protein MAINTENANCE OF MERISTEMS-like protein n=1 Tax=Cinnamomum micranthum f. kanehirae TaxID=337451 RepID=A0A3S3Q9N3_9MAGN|nr:protein MAINTENANCE OF MERISTEMS-like protein [Cinnamomum micranthum f. kanehirae]
MTPLYVFHSPALQNPLPASSLTLSLSLSRPSIEALSLSREPLCRSAVVPLSLSRDPRSPSADLSPSSIDRPCKWHRKLSSLYPFSAYRICPSILAGDDDLSSSMVLEKNPLVGFFVWSLMSLALLANQNTREIAKFDTKCCPSRFKKFIDDLKLEDVHVKAIGETPFRQFTEMPTNLKCQRTFLSMIITRWDNEKSAFHLGGKLLPVLPQDVALIMGLNMNGERIQLGTSGLKEECEFVDKYLEKKYIGTETLEQHLKAISEKIASNNKKTLDKKLLDLIADFKKLYMLYVCSTLLFPKSCRSFPFNIIFMVDKLEKVNDYAWAIAVHEFLIESIRQSSRKNTGFINGCVMLLEPWFYEHVNRYAPIRINAYPRYMRWAKSSKYMQSKSIKAILDNLSYTEVIEEITPTQEEITLLSPPKVSQETTAMADFIVRRMEERMPDIIGDRENYKMKIKDLEQRITILEEENERLKSENMELRSQGISVPHSPVDIVDDSLRRMDHPSSPSPSMSSPVETSRAAEHISKKTGEEEDAIASFEAKVGKDAEEVGVLKIWRSEIHNLLDEEGWISDKIIDGYATLISGRKPTGGLNSLKCYFFTSWFNVSVLKEQFKQKKIHKWDDADIHFVDDCPQQDNGYDCGVYVMKFMDCLSRGIGQNRDTIEKDCQSCEETRSKKKRSTIRTTRGRSSEPHVRSSEPTQRSIRSSTISVRSSHQFSGSQLWRQNIVCSSEPHVRSSDPTQRSLRSTKLSARSSHQFSGSQFWRQNIVRSSDPNDRSIEPITELSSLDPRNICAERFHPERGSLERTTCPLERIFPEKSSLDQNFSPLEPSALWIAILETEHSPLERTHRRAQFARPNEYLC